MSINTFWGKRYGYTDLQGNWLTVRSFGGTSRTASKDQQKNKNKNSPQSKRDRIRYAEHFAKYGTPVVVYNHNGRRIFT